MASYFKNNRKDIIMTEKDEKDFDNHNICRFCEKKNISDKVREHCRLTGKYRGPAHNTCNINFTEKQSNFIPFIFHNFCNYDCHMFFQKFVDKKIDEVTFDSIPKTTEKYNGVTYGCIRFIDSYRFLSSSLDSSVRTLVNNNHKMLRNLEKEIDIDEILNIVDEIGEEDRTFEDLQKDYPNEIEKLEEFLLNYIGKNDLKLLKTEFPDKWKYLTKKFSISL